MRTPGRRACGSRSTESPTTVSQTNKTTSSTIENVAGAGSNDILSGSEVPETFEGNDGNDQITPGEGSDTVRGGNGDDVIDVREPAHPELDSVSCGLGNDEVIADLTESSWPGP